MDLLKKLLIQENGGLGDIKTNRHPTCPERILNCCFDWYKFVFPYASIDYLKASTTYHEIYNEYKHDLPDLSSEELFDLIEKDYPGLRPGLVWVRNNNEKEEDPITNVWSFNKIQTALIHWFNLKEFIPDSSVTSYKYSTSFKYIREFTPGIYLMYEGPEMKYLDEDGHMRYYKTCCIELKGAGCRKVEELNVNLLDLLFQLYSIPGCHATRVDFATDVINDDTINFEWLLKKIVMKHFVSSYKKGHLYDSFIVSSESLDFDGFTITFGSNSSTSKLNIYDKKAERENNAGIDVTISSWLRFEIQMKDEKGDNAIHSLMKNISTQKFNEFCISLLFSHLDIKINENLYNDINFRPSKRRTWPTDPIWKEFIEDVSKIKIRSQAKLESDFVRTRNWYDTAVNKTQTFLDMLYDEEPSAKIKTIKNQIAFLNEVDDKHLSIWNQYRKKEFGCKTDLTYEDIKKRIQHLHDELNYLKKNYDMEISDEI